MSKGEAFEKIIELLEKSISDEDTVVERDKKVVDLDGVHRQIDVYITSKLNKRTYVTIIECKDYERRVSIEKIESFASMCSRLKKVDKKIFVSSNGFQSGAIKKAETNNIELYEITEEDNDVEREFDIKNVSFIQKRGDLLSLNFDTSILKHKELNEKITLCDKEGTHINNEEVEETLLNVSDIWRFLFTEKGYIFNYKKTIFPHLRTKGLFIRKGNDIYELKDLQATVEIEIIYETHSFKTLKNYFSFTENQALAQYSELDFGIGKDRYKICVVKSDTNNKDFFISSDLDSGFDRMRNYGSMNLSLHKEIKKPHAKAKVRPLLFNLSNKAKNYVDSEASKPQTNQQQTNLVEELKSLFFFDQNKLGFMIPLSISDKLITARFPEPISLYFAHSIELFNKSEEYKEVLVATAPESGFLKFQDRDYYSFISYRLSSFQMLNSAMITFINYCLSRGGDSKKLKNLSLSEKLDLIIKGDRRLKQIQNEIIELNTISFALNSLEVVEASKPDYLKDFEAFLKFDIENSFSSFNDFILKVKPDFKLFGQ